MIQQRNAVLAGLTTSEEAYWDDRIHYIDMDASNLGGGIGAMIGSFNNPSSWGSTDSNSARETGSLYAWTSQSNDPFHLSYEPNQWVAEFPTKVREQDSAVHAVSIMDFNGIPAGGAAAILRLAMQRLTCQTISHPTIPSRSTTNTPYWRTNEPVSEIRRFVRWMPRMGLPRLHVRL